MYVTKIAFRYLWSRPITWFSTISILMLVCNYVVVMTVLRGFSEFLRDNVRKTSAHVEIDRPSVTGLSDYAALGERVKQAAAPHVIDWTPMVQGIVLVQTAQFRHYALLRGLDLEKERLVEKKLGQPGISEIKGVGKAFFGLEPDNPENFTIVGKRIAVELNLDHGQLITLTAQAGQEGAAKRMFFNVQSIYEAGSIWFDRFLLMDYRVAQRLYGLGDAVTGIGLWLDDYNNAEVVRRQAYLLGLDPPAAVLAVIEFLQGADKPRTIEDIAQETDLALGRVQDVVGELLYRRAVVQDESGSVTMDESFDPAFLETSAEQKQVYLNLLDHQPERRTAEQIAKETGLAPAVVRRTLEELEVLGAGAAIPIVWVDYEDPDGNPIKIDVRIDDERNEQGAGAERTGAYVFQNPAGYRVRSWREQQPEVFASIDAQNSGMTFIFIIFGFVIMMLIFALMIILVGDKAKDIGVLRAVGATRRGIMGIFLLNGAVIGLLGGLAGIGLGLVLVSDFVLGWFPGFSGDGSLPQVLFGIDTIPKYYDVWFLAKLYSAVVLLTVISAVIPAIMASRVDPLETIRHD